MALVARHPTVRVVADLMESPGDALPPVIGGHRPDIYARCNIGCLRLIAEAKTDGDIDNGHTHSQIDAFIGHLAALAVGTGIFVLSVNGEVADIARTVLRFTCREFVSPKLQVELFDGLDFWTLGKFGAQPWRLS